jgi:hypothetical protein
MHELVHGGPPDAAPDRVDYIGTGGAIRRIGHCLRRDRDEAHRAIAAEWPEHV